MSSYLTDNATSDPQRDALYFSDFRPALKEILTRAETPLTVGVFGAWGSGKTSLMRMLRGEIEAEQKPKARTVWFTAWKYDRHDALWRTLILRVLAAMYPREPGDGPREERPIIAEPNEKEQKLINLLRKLEESVYQDVQWQELGGRNIRWWQLLSNSGMAAADIAVALGSLGLAPLLKDLVGSEETTAEKIQKAAQAISRETISHQRRRLFHMEQFEETFKEAVSLIDEARLIVYVDDLDRCLPEKGIEVLEAIKLFLEVSGVVFVLGMDREVVQRGIEARYGRFFHQQLGRDAELPIRGDTYLQKIVQIPFHLPSLPVANLDKFMAGLDSGLDDVTRGVFARGLFPNPRQVKRALNIFRLLQAIARRREARPAEEGGLPRGSIAWPLLAKTVVIQSQYQELYQIWRQYPVAVQRLEQEFSRRIDSDDRILMGRSEEDYQADEKLSRESSGKLPTDRDGGLLATYLDGRPANALLAQMLAYPPAGETRTGRGRSRFEGLNREQLAAYVQLAGMVEVEEELPPDLPADLLSDLLSGDRLKMADAASRLVSDEPDEKGPKHEVHRKQLVQIIENRQEPVERRLSAGDALGLIGDLRKGVATREPDMISITEDLTFLMGEEKQEVTISQPFAIAKYPVTNAQFRFFIDAGGYNIDQFWTAEGLDYRNKEKWTQPRWWDDPKFKGSNQPVVGVSWYEALAYANWLAQVTGKNYRLPTEAQWERAARHSDGRVYPWGDQWDRDKANTKESGLQRPSPVGAFPGGKAECGALEMSGNVWEWCLDWVDDSEKGRVLRGGSWGFVQDDARVAIRRRVSPLNGNDSIGFRLVSPSVLASDS